VRHGAGPRGRDLRVRNVSGNVSMGARRQLEMKRQYECACFATVWGSSQLLTDHEISELQVRPQNMRVVESTGEG
jgi:hypothetical protein